MQRLLAGTFVTNLGNGAWFVAWAIFLTESVGLTPAQVGLGMSAATALGALLATPAGHVADRLGPRRVWVGLLVVQTGGFALYPFVHGFGGFMVVAVLTLSVNSMTGGPRNAMVTAIADDVATALGRLRAANHIGVTLGALGGAAVVAADTRGAFVALVAFDGITYAIYALLVAGAPYVPPRPARREGPALVVLRDRPYAALAGIIGVLSLCWGMLSTALPLWVVRHTEAPRAAPAVLVAVTSLIIAAAQAPVARLLRAPRSAARGALWSGALLAASCVAFALTYHRGGVLAIALLAVGGALHVAGELVFVAAEWGLSIPLMDPDAPGQYQGLFSAGEALAQTVSPAIMTTLVVGWAPGGFLALGALFALVVLPAPRITRRALSQRETVSRAWSSPSVSTT
jgi:MFS family permease